MAGGTFQGVDIAALMDQTGQSDGQLLENFIRTRADGAFETLVKRHGPMVLGVCRRVLRNEHDADDAFQATFLVLVRRATRVTPKDMVGHWLYGVAYKTAIKAKSLAAKRRLRERQFLDELEPIAHPHKPADEIHRLLDQELSRLPAKYRIPIVLCELEGKSYKDAARLLGLTTGAVSVRLVRGREMLARRLVRCGIEASPGLLILLLPHSASAAPVASSLVESTVSAAGQFAAGQTPTSGVSANVVALTEGVLKAMMLSQLQTASVAGIIIGTVGIGLGGLVYATQAGRAAQEAETAAVATSQPAVPATDADSEDRKQLQGTWIATSAVNTGKEAPKEAVKQARITLTISGDRFSLKTSRGGNEAIKGTLKIDAKSKPRTMDWISTRVVPDGAADDVGRPLGDLPGIYRLEGDTLTFCYGRERPEEFTSKPDRKLEQRLYVFERQKP